MAKRTTVKSAGRTRPASPDEQTQPLQTPRPVSHAAEEQSPPTPVSVPTVHNTAGDKVADPNASEIIYVPREGDPATTSFAGIKFAAYCATRVSKMHSIMVPMRVETEMGDGTIQTRHVEKRVSVVELLKGNPWFKVDGKQAMSQKGAQRVPQDSDQYRGYCISWIAGSTNHETMRVRWDGEESLRERCGCSEDDIAYLMPFFEARHDECEALAKQGGVKAA